MKFSHYIKHLTGYTDHLVWYLFIIFASYTVTSLCLVGTAAWLEWSTQMITETQAELGIQGASAPISDLSNQVGIASSQVINPLQDSGLLDLLPDKSSVISWLNGISSAFWVSASLVFFLLFRGIGEFFGTYASKKIGMQIGAGLRSELFQVSIHLPVSLFDRVKGGGITSRIIYTCPKVTNSFVSLLSNLVRHSLQFFMLLAYMLWLSYTLTGLIFIITPMVFGILYFVSKIIREHSRNQQRAFHSVSKVIDETVTGYKTVKVYQAEQVQQNQFDEMNQMHEKSGFSVAMITALVTPVIVMAGAFMLATIAYGVANGWIVGFNAGRVISFFISTTLLFNSLRTLIGLNTVYQEFMAASEEIFNHIQAETEQTKVGIQAPDSLGMIKLKNISFSYDAKNDVVKNMNLDIQKGETICFAGANGSGKSTIMSLLSRFYEPSSGVITIDGVDISKYSLHSFRSKIAMVPQEVFIFDDTLRNNIIFSNSKATEEEIIAAAKVAEAHDFIMLLSNGYDTVVGRNGTLLSGGQRQRIALCRAIIRKPSILFIDEATSAMDARAEAKIIGNLKKLPFNPTVIAVSHREEQLQVSDRIFVLENGKLVETGTHSSLMNSDSGAYSKLYSRPSSSLPTIKPNAIDWEEELKVDSDQQSLLIPANKEYAESFEKKLNKTWYKEKSVTSLFLLPISWLFQLVISTRIALFATGFFKKIVFPAKVVVIGNINVGGSGKTPMVLATVEHLLSKGLKVGVASRGYGAHAKFYPQIVNDSSMANELGDEAIMIYNKTNALVVVSNNRVQACELLCRHHVDVIVCDDGLQDYRVHRDIEVIMVDAKLQYGNRRILPAGPLREPTRRIKLADFVVYKCTDPSDLDLAFVPNSQKENSFAFSYEPKHFVNIETLQKMQADEWPNTVAVQAVAGIAQPELFFQTLAKLDISFNRIPFPDHHNFIEDDFDFNNDNPIITTEKDAVKCKDMEGKKIWALEMKGKLSDKFWKRFDDIIDT